MSRNPGSSSQVHSDEEESFNGRWNGGTRFDVDHFLTGQEKGLHPRDEAKEQREHLVDLDFFNGFADDFDESDML